jgi:HEAT repeat protein
LPALTEAAKDLDIGIRHPAVQTLGLIGRKTKGKTIVVALTGALNDPDLGVCTAAADWLGAIGTEAKEALPSLTRKMRDPSPHAREWAAYAICRIGGPPEDPMRVLVSLLKDDSRDIRWNTVCHLFDLGALAKPALPALTETLLDPDASIREMAGKALAKLDPDAAARLIQRQ